MHMCISLLLLENMGLLLLLDINICIGNFESGNCSKRCSSYFQVIFWLLALQAVHKWLEPFASLELHMHDLRDWCSA